MAIYYTKAENQAAGRGDEAGSIFPEMVANPVRLLNANGTYVSPSETHGTMVYTNGQWVCENGNHKLTEEKKDATCTEDGYTAHVRNFAPLYDIPEESATGTANAALTYYLYHNGIIPQESKCTFMQGEAMGRPSVVSTELRSNGTVYVGGNSYILAKGEMLM